MSSAPKSAAKQATSKSCVSVMCWASINAPCLIYQFKLASGSMHSVCLKFCHQSALVVKSSVTRAEDDRLPFSGPQVVDYV